MQPEICCCIAIPWTQVCRGGVDGMTHKAEKSSKQLLKRNDNLKTNIDALKMIFETFLCNCKSNSQ